MTTVNPPTQRLLGKTAFITGAATGIGLATARLFSREGARVALADINSSAGERAAKDIASKGGKAVFIFLDVSREDQWPRAWQEAQLALGTIHILVNNAGVASPVTPENVTLESWRRMREVNVDGPFLGIRQAIGSMKKTGGGRIINVGSISGMVGDPDLPFYSATKGALNQLSLSASQYCARENLPISVNAILPGAVKTNMSAPYMATPRDLQALAEAHPLGRIAQPEEMALAILFLAAQAPANLTGAQLVVDGGLTAQ
ncbi:MAG: glucose 1-dehydrogenase [Deltaproteobacteria bacterium]|nr:glucose 1-dehydrogenase [Deltaproteobacteria bacterium]